MLRGSANAPAGTRAVRCAFTAWRTENPAISTAWHYAGLRMNRRNFLASSSVVLADRMLPHTGPAWTSRGSADNVRAHCALAYRGLHARVRSGNCDQDDRLQRTGSRPILRLHRHTLEVARVGTKRFSGLRKDVVNVMPSRLRRCRFCRRQPWRYAAALSSGIAYGIRIYAVHEICGLT